MVARLDTIKDEVLKDPLVQLQPASYILNDVSRAPLMIMILSAIVCLGCSATFHLLSVQSPLAHSILARLDYAGISVLIYGSVVPIIEYRFAC